MIPAGKPLQEQLAIASAQFAMRVARDHFSLESSPALQ
jgi:hypothetical protein